MALIDASTVMAEFDFGGNHGGHNHGDSSSVVYMYPDGEIVMVCALRLYRSDSIAVQYDSTH